MSEAQTLAEAGKPKVDKDAPGASNQIREPGQGAKQYRVIHPRGFFFDRKYEQGEVVIFDGKPSPNVLEEIKGEKPARKPRKSPAAKNDDKAESSDEVL